MNTVKVEDFQIEELACFLTGLDYDKHSDDCDKIESELYDKFGIELNNLTNLIQHILPIILVSESPLTNKVYKGLVNAERKMWIVKTEAPEYENE